jgi:tetratricopeptide (TPR) repeat protein
VLSWPKWSHEALPLAEQALQLAEQFHGAEGFEVAESLDALASALGHTEGASRRRVELFDRAIRIIEKAGQGDGAEAISYLNGAAIARRSIGDLEGAERLYRRALEIVERVCGPDSWRMPDLLGALGHVLTEKGQAADAVPILERALRLEEVSGEEDSTVVVLALQGLATALRKAGRAAEALPLLDRALRALGPRENGGLGVMVLTVRALALYDVGELEAARHVARRALEIAAARWGADSESTSDVRDQLRDLVVSHPRT